MPPLSAPCPNHARPPRPHITPAARRQAHPPPLPPPSPRRQQPNNDPRHATGRELITSPRWVNSNEHRWVNSAERQGPAIVVGLAIQEIDRRLAITVVENVGRDDRHV